jgi:hypothetical protein
MKRRLGFVSNSSSSSFVAIGFKVDEELSDEARDELEQFDCSVLSGYEGGVKDGEIVVAKIFATGDEYLEYSENSLPEILHHFEEVRAIAGEKYKDREIKFFTGTRMC